MRNVIQQIITLYPNDNLIVAMESGDNSSGRAGNLIPGPNTNPDSGLFELKNTQGTVEEAVSLCRIASIKVTSATYNGNITYLPESTPALSGCDANCANAIKTYLPIGSMGAIIKAGGQTVAQGTVRRSESGMVVVVEANDSNPTFVSSCKIEIIKK